MASYIRAVMNMIWRDPTTAPDGRTAEQAGAVDASKTGVLHDLIHLGGRDAKTMVNAFNTLASGEPMNDKELLLENSVYMLQKLPPNSGLGSKVAGGFIKMLWQDLPHPPGTLAGPDSKYRRHDGGGNNLTNPEMGKAGSPYSRSVPSVKTKGPNLPDPELVWEHLLKRKGPFRKHPSGLNRFFFSFATVVIHECFQTSRKNQWINETSSYVDLSTLYGNTFEEQKRVRTFHNGLIYKDSIASERIMLMPPGVVAVLMLFSRNHNSIADNLYSINEEGKYKKWEKLTPEEQKWQDNDIFQTARNINVGFFASVVLRDYVAAILNTPRADSKWSLDLGGEIKMAGNRVERGAGNVVSVEFAVLYHWHASLSAADAEWMEELLRDTLGDELKSLDQMSPELFWKVVKKEGHRLMSMEPRKWEFGYIKRGPDGAFADADLGKIIKDCIEEPAHAFGAHGTPQSLKVVDLMGQIQARDTFNVCTLNEFRRYLNLKPYESFEEWAGDDHKDTARAAELLYGHIENLELYPGLQAECTKPAMEGSGVCPGQTTGRGILDDAVALVRGDRFLTYDFNSTTLTNWGFSKLTTPTYGSYGGILPGLLFNHLPGEFLGTSSYALLQFYTPEAQKDILRGNKVTELYLTDRPPSGNAIVGVHTHEGCKKVFEDRDTFRVMYQPAIRNCTAGHDFMIGWDEQKRHDDRSNLLHKIFFDDKFEAKLSTYFRENVRALIKKNSMAYYDDRRSVDIVRDVTNVVPIMWLADRFAIPLKTAEHPRGLISVPELFDIYLILFIYQSFNVIPANEWKLRELAMKHSSAIRKILESHLKTQQGITEGVVDWMAKGSAFEVKPEADRLYHALNDSKLPIGDLVGDCIGMSAPIAGNLTQQASLLIDLYLSENYKDSKARIVELANRDDAASDKELVGFVFEGMRHAGVVPGLPRVASRDVVVEDGDRGSVQIKANQTVLIATSTAAMDPKAFPNPEKIDPNRPLSSYLLLGHGLHYCFGARMVAPALAATLKEVFRLKDICRAPGAQGRFSTLEHDVAGVKMRHYLDANARESPIPTNLHIQYKV